MFKGLHPLTSPPQPLVACCCEDLSKDGPEWPKVVPKPDWRSMGATVDEVVARYR